MTNDCVAANPSLYKKLAIHFVEVTFMHISVLLDGTNVGPVAPLPFTKVSLLMATLTDLAPFSTVNSTTVPIGNATLAFAGIVYVRGKVSDTG